MFRDVEDPQLDLHFNMPQPLGGPSKDSFEQPLVPAPRINLIQATLPETPGMVPLAHLTIQSMMDFHRLAVPYVKSDASYEETLGNVSQLFGEVAFDDELLDEAAAFEDASLAQRIEPLFLVALQFAITLGTLLFLALEIRYAIIWFAMALLGGFFTLTDRSEPLDPVQSADLGWGLGIGFIVGLPLLIILRPSLTNISTALFPFVELSSLMLFLLLAVPIAETFFFRGMVQERRGYFISVLLAGLSTLLIFLPALRDISVGLAGFVVIFLTGMAALYGYIRLRYGLGSALVAQIAVNLLVIVLPALFT